MSDPFSIAGSAVGVISLGISVCGGLLDYYRSWKGLDDDATRICKYVDDLNSILEVIEAIIQRDEFRGESRRLVEERVVSCAAALRELDAVWKKFRDVPNSPKAKYRISSYLKRACYPFQEQTLSKIQSSASELRDNLSLAVGTLNAEIAADNRHTLTELQSILGEVSHDTAMISQRLDDYSQYIQRAEDNVSTVRTDLKSTELSIQTRLDRLPTDTAVAIRRDLLSTHFALEAQIPNFDQSARQQQEQFKAMCSEFAVLRSVLLKIFSKPSLTRNVCDSFNNIHGQDSEPSTLTEITRSNGLSQQFDCLSRPRCTCRKTSSYNLLSFSPLGLGFEFRHLKSCSLRTESDKKLKCWLRVRPPRWILAKSISATFSASFGAGGFSLEPVFMVQHVVDSKTFPSFLAIGRFEKSITRLNSRGNLDGYEKVTGELLEQLSALSKRGLCSPLLVNEFGKNLLDYFIRPCLYLYIRQNDASLLEVLDFLISGQNIPLTSSSIGMVLEVELHFNLEHDMSRYLRVEYNRSRRDDVVLSLDGYLCRRHSAYLLREWSDMMEDFAFGPVTRAVAERSVSKLDALITLGHSLHERTFNKQNPLHLAAGWPPGLQRLLDAGLDPNSQAEYETLPIESAIEANCFESSQILIAAGSKLLFLPNGLARCSEPLRKLAITTLAQQRRECLVELKKKLPQWSLLELLNPSDRLVPDEVGITLALLTHVDGTLRRTNWLQGTVFHHSTVWCSSMAELLFDEGFRDINSFDTDGLTPLMKACICGIYQNTYFIVWLLEKDCDPLCFDASGVTTSFHLFADHVEKRESLELIPFFLAASSSPTRRRPSDLFWTCWHAYYLKTKEQKVMDPKDYQDIFESKYQPYEIDKTQNNLEEALSHFEAASRLVSTKDRCQCSCAPDGCAATAKLYSPRGKHSPHVEITLNDWCSSFNLGPGDLIGMIHRDYIRLRAFEKLGITHVCCMSLNDEGFRKPIWDFLVESKETRLERILEIQEEESELIDRLEIFMERYDEAFRQNDGPAMEFVELWEQRIQEEDEEFLWSFPLHEDGVSEISPDEDVDNDDETSQDGA